MPIAVAIIRQWLCPAEFRIPAPDATRDWLGDVRRLVAELADTKVESDPPPTVDQVRLLIEIANGAWRLRRRMIDPATGDAKDTFRREAHHLETVWEALAEGGLRILDHDGEPFELGRSMKVATRVPTQGISRERVQDTIRPTIYYKNRHVQQAEVVVETPLKPPPASEPATEARNDVPNDASDISEPPHAEPAGEPVKGE